MKSQGGVRGAGEDEAFGGVLGHARWMSTLPSKVNLPHAIDFRAKFGHEAPKNLGSY